MTALPEPDAGACASSARLQSQIREEIIAQGPMTFAQYMKLALYAPELGYYRCGAQKFGKYGDFITAPELSPLFSQCIARQCQQVLADLGGGDILEFGAGSGVMARTILQTLAKKSALPHHYYILELSAELRHRQQMELQTHLPDLCHKIIWLDRFPTEKLRGIILANEVLDAMPVHRFGFLQGFQEYYVTLKEEQLGWHLGAPSSLLLLHHLCELDTEFPDGYSSEINLWIPGWVASVAGILENGVILLTDYGMTRREYYHFDRGCGTLLCHYRHRAHANPFWWPGLQDITAQVDFTAVAIAAEACGLSVEGYTHQAAFLLNCGITDFVAHAATQQEQMTLSRQIRQLTLPGEMGEAFKAMALSKNYNESLIGFQQMNQLERL